MAQRSKDHARRQKYLESPSAKGIYIGNPSGLSTYKIGWLPMDDGSGGHVLADTSRKESSHAILLAVLRITEDCWVHPVGKWKGPTEHTDSLADMKLNCSGTIPGAGVFRDDFQHVIRNLESIRKMIASPGIKKRGSLVPVAIGDPTDENKLKVKFHHKLFKEKKSVEIGVRTRANTRGQHDWNMDNWPGPGVALSVAARNALEDMKTTHIVDPLPLYDSKNNAVEPELYHKSLIGATVEVKFNLCHWCIKDEKTGIVEDVYVAYIDNMYILPGVPAMALSPPGKKLHSTAAYSAEASSRA
ncbi:hypothetical protein ARMGADRAFT_1006074 [Armillaria gallica]|uniref:Uncharacterized protein n=1 Tax=Armillaria gallica TaxID=47427 RepID=A0A2H3EIY0_ARMGA|nr:hypothetical protein ARMGADRAFT_1006074 [Armillaria gallica]